MSIETTKRMLLNSLLTVCGSLLGTVLANSGKVLFHVKRLITKIVSKRQKAAVEDDTDRDQAPNSLRNLRDYYQRKEGFRQ